MKTDTKATEPIRPTMSDLARACLFAAAKGQWVRDREEGRRALTEYYMDLRGQVAK